MVLVDCKVPFPDVCVDCKVPLHTSWHHVSDRHPKTNGSTSSLRQQYHKRHHHSGDHNGRSSVAPVAITPASSTSLRSRPSASEQSRTPHNDRSRQHAYRSSSPVSPLPSPSAIGSTGSGRGNGRGGIPSLKRRRVASADDEVEGGRAKVTKIERGSDEGGMRIRSSFPDFTDSYTNSSSHYHPHRRNSHSQSSSQGSTSSMPEQSPRSSGSRQSSHSSARVNGSHSRETNSSSSHRTSPCGGRKFSSQSHQARSTQSNGRSSGAPTASSSGSGDHEMSDIDAPAQTNGRAASTQSNSNNKRDRERLSRSRNTEDVNMLSDSEYEEGFDTSSGAGDSRMPSHSARVKDGGAVRSGRRTPTPRFQPLDDALRNSVVSSKSANRGVLRGMCVVGNRFIGVLCCELFWMSCVWFEINGILQTQI